MRSKLKPLLFVFSILFSIGMYAQDMSTLRTAFKLASQSKEQSQQFLALAEQAYQKDKSTMLLGYRGVALAVNASFSKNIFTKIGDFNKGKRMIDQAIAQDTDSIELRLIRLSVQANAPKIAGYYRNIDEDKTFILMHLAKVQEQNLKAFIQGFIDSTAIF